MRHIAEKKKKEKQLKFMFWKKCCDVNYVYIWNQLKSGNFIFNVTIETILQSETNLVVSCTQWLV